ncbi:MAG: hypothetical protein ABFQ65_03995 [Nanoarchaeota archaeon]
MCKLCETKPVYEFTNKRKVCKNCFVRYFQKKFLFIIRKFEMIKKGDVVGYKKGIDFRDIVLEDLLNMFSEKGMVEIVRMPSTPQMYPEKSFATLKSVPREKKDFSTKDKIFTKGKKKINKIAVSSTIDSEADKIVHILIEGDVKDLKEIAPVNKKIIKPLYLFLDAEVLLYAKIKKLKFKKTNKKKDKLSLFIDELEKKHPEIKRAILNSYLELEK